MGTDSLISSDEPIPGSSAANKGKQIGSLDVINIEHEMEDTNGFFDASIWSKLVWSFPRPVLKRGKQQPLAINDLHRIAPVDSAVVSLGPLQKNWEAEKARVLAINTKRLQEAVTHRGPDGALHVNFETPSLLSVVLKTFFLEYFLTSLFAVAEFATSIGSVVLLQELVSFVNEAKTGVYDYPTYAGYLFAIAMAILTLATTVLHHQYFFHASRVGMHAKNALMALLYNTSLRFTVASLSQFSSGFAVNVMSNDPFRLEDAGPFVAYIWTAPMAAVVGLWLVYREIGVSVFFGTAVLVLQILFQFYSSVEFARIRTAIVLHSDARVKAVNEVVIGCDIVKMYAWEKPLHARITEEREQEMVHMRRNINLKGINLGTYFAAFTLISLLTWTLHIARGERLNSVSVFSVLGYYGVIAFPLTQFVPFGVERVSEIVIACGRMQRLLLIGEDYKGLGSCGITAVGGDGHNADQSDVIVGAAEEDGIVHDSREAEAMLAPALGPTSSITTRSAPDMNADASTTGTANSDSHSTDANAGAGVAYAGDGGVAQADKLTVQTTEPALKTLTITVTSPSASPSSTSTSTSTSATSAELSPSFAVPIAQQPVGTILIPGVSFAWPLHSADSAETAAKKEDSRSSKKDEEKEKVDATTSADSKTAEDATSSAGGLSHLRINVKPGELVGIVGSVGAYKSSLLQAIMGEMPRKDEDSETPINLPDDCASPYVRGTLSYAAQRPWLMLGSVRDNITFGAELNRDRYAHAIWACALGRDIQLMSQGDKTIIGERGGNLSGGQRARIALARAVYNEADVYLFDDVLSAVDQLVAAHIFTHALSNTGVLRGKTRVLVTHNESLLASCDKIIVMAHGQVQHMGTHAELLARGVFCSAEPPPEPLLSPLPAAPSIAAINHDETQMVLVPTQDLSHTVPGVPEAQIKAQAKQKAKESKGDDTETAAASLSLDDVKALLALPPPPAAAVIAEEARHSGSIPFAVYKAFLIAGRPLYTLFLFLLLVAPAVLKVAADTWLADWASADPVLSQTDSHYRDVFIYLCSFCIAAALIRAVLLMRHALYAADKVQADMTKGIIFASLSFFQSNPAGRILNRFSKDLELLCSFFPPTFFDFLQVTTTVLSALVVVGIVVPWILISLIVIIPMFVYYRQEYIPASRDVKRLDATTRSPILSLFSSSLSGLPIIRAFRMEESFQTLFAALLDINTRVFMAYHYTSRWLGLRLDCICVILTLATGIFCSAMRDSMDPSKVGYVLSSLISVAALIQWMTRQSAEIENLLTSAERVIEYGNLPPEGVLNGVLPMFACPAHADIAKQLAVSEDANADAVSANVVEPKTGETAAENADVGAKDIPSQWPCVTYTGDQDRVPQSATGMLKCGGDWTTPSGDVLPIDSQDTISAILAQGAPAALSRLDELTKALATLQHQETEERKREIARKAMAMHNAKVDARVNKGGNDAAAATAAAATAAAGGGDIEVPEVEDADVSGIIDVVVGATTADKIKQVAESLKLIQLDVVKAPTRMQWRRNADALGHAAEAQKAEEDERRANALTNTHTPDETERISLKPPAGWPWRGSVTVDSAIMAYRPGLPVVLRGLTLRIEPGQKVGVCGRTGAGKSSLLNVLFRLTPLYYGRVLIDGVDTAHVGLHDLRHALAIIPQAPVIFSGSIRYNLDPFGNYDDVALEDALAKVHLTSLLSSMPQRLDTMLSEGGSNLSVGEAQLLCIARALLMPSKILMLDECTANCDKTTDQLIQQVIRDCFKERTTITIAHRLHTIMNSDTIVVMEAGRIVEQGAPQELLERDGVFASMYYAQQRGEEH